jgi:toxin ParE1/3/4
VDDRIRVQVGRLARYPESGRPGRVAGTRELVIRLIRRTPYVAAYRIAGDTVRILRVLHGAQQWPEDMSEEPQE